MPPIYKGIKETDEVLSIEQKIINTYLSDQDVTYKNTFVLTSNEEGIRRYEDLLEILPDPSVETLDFRKERVINRLCLRYPFTWLYLIWNILNSFLGEGNYSAYINFNEYTLTLKTYVGERNKMNELMITLYKIIPANIIFVAENEIVCYTIGNKFLASAVSPCFYYQLSSNLNAEYEVSGNKVYASVINPVGNITLTMNHTVDIHSTSQKYLASAPSVATRIQVPSILQTGYVLETDMFRGGAVNKGSRVELTSSSKRSYEAEGHSYRAGASSLNTKYELQ